MADDRAIRDLVIPPSSYVYIQDKQTGQINTIAS